jgi:alkylated DNA nucleotide flippase Atl1
VPAPPPDLPEFAARVLDVVDRVPPGQVVTYGDVAEYLGEGGPRQVGAVMSRHGGAVAWWRVLRADGSPPPGLEGPALAHYRAEGTPLRASGTRVDLARARWAGDLAAERH